MANPYDIKYLVKAEEAPLTYNGECYLADEVIRVKQNHIGCFMGQLPPEEPLDCCFPEYCVGPDGVPFSGYRVPFTIPAGEVAILPIPSIEGCNPPNKVRFFYCSGCVYLGIDADPLVDPEDPVAANGGGAYPNPTMIDLTGCEETIHLSSGDASDVSGMLMFYCQE